MSIQAIAEQLKAKGEKNVEVRGGQLYVNGRLVPVVADGDQPYMSDCPNGKCNI